MISFQNGIMLLKLWKPLLFSIPYFSFSVTPVQSTTKSCSLHPPSVSQPVPSSSEASKCRLSWLQPESITQPPGRTPDLWASFSNHPPSAACQPELPAFHCLAAECKPQAELLCWCVRPFLTWLHPSRLPPMNLPPNWTHQAFSTFLLWVLRSLRVEKASSSLLFSPCDNVLSFFSL